MHPPQNQPPELEESIGAEADSNIADVLDLKHDSVGRIRRSMENNWKLLVL